MPRNSPVTINNYVREQILEYVRNHFAPQTIEHLSNLDNESLAYEIANAPQLRVPYNFARREAEREQQNNRHPQNWEAYNTRYNLPAENRSSIGDEGRSERRRQIEIAGNIRRNNFNNPSSVAEPIEQAREFLLDRRPSGRANNLRYLERVYHTNPQETIDLALSQGWNPRIDTSSTIDPTHVRTPSPQRLTPDILNPRPQRNISTRSSPSSAAGIEEEIRRNLRRSTQARESVRPSPESAFRRPEPSRPTPAQEPRVRTTPDRNLVRTPTEDDPLFNEVPLNERNGQTRFSPIIPENSNSDAEDIPMPGSFTTRNSPTTPIPERQNRTQFAQNQSRSPDNASGVEEAELSDAEGRRREEDFSQRFASASASDRLRRRRARESRTSRNNLRNQGRRNQRIDNDSSDSEEELNYPENWIRPAEEYSDPLPAYQGIQSSDRMGYIPSERPALPPVGTTQALQHGPLHVQEANRAVIEAGLDIASAPHVPYTGNMTANLSNAEKRARVMHASENPFINKRIRNEEREISDSIRKIQRGKRASETSKPYLDKMSESPDKLHNKLLGAFEREHLRTLREEADENFFNKILPEARRKYLVPGLKQSGSMNNTMRDLVRDYTKGQTSVMNEARMKNRLATFGVSQEYARQQGAAADIASKNVMQDVERDTKTTDMLHTANERRRAARYQAAKTQQELGREERALEQKKLNEARILDIEAKEAPYRKLNELNSLIRGQAHPIQKTTIGQLREDPKIDATNIYQHGAGALGGLAGNLMPRTAKKGGFIRSRLKRAAGGSVIDEAVQNAVIDRSDPLSELRRLMNRQRMVDVMETSIGRRRYASGGLAALPTLESYGMTNLPMLYGVREQSQPYSSTQKIAETPEKRMAEMIGISDNPISKGAQDARSFLGEKNLRKQINFIKTPRENPRGTSMIDAAMHGMASVGGSGMGDAARAYSQSADREEHRLNSARKERTRAMQMDYDLDKEIKREESAARKEAREEARLLRQEQMQERQFGSSEARHKERMDLERMKLGYDQYASQEGADDRPTRKQTPKDKNNSFKSSEAAKKKIDAIERVQDAGRILRETYTGPLTSAWNTATRGVLSTDKVNDAKEKTNQALTAVKKTTDGGRQTNALLAADQAAKLNIGASPEINRENEEDTIAELQQSVIEDARIMLKSGEPLNEVRRVLYSAGLTEDDLYANSSVKARKRAAKEQSEKEKKTFPVNSDNELKLMKAALDAKGG